MGTVLPTKLYYCVEFFVFLFLIFKRIKVMLSEKYKSALKGFKAQGNASHLFDGCDVEAKHVYRIIMTENISVTDIDEKMLEMYLDQERKGLADYSKQVDHDGLQFVDLEKDVEVYPCVGHGFLEPIDGQNYIIPSEDAKKILLQLKKMRRLSLITDTLQSLAQRQDGTKLQTALPELIDIKSCISNGLILHQDFLDKISLWGAMNCSVVNFDFEERRS